MLLDYNFHRIYKYGEFMLFANREKMLHYGFTSDIALAANIIFVVVLDESCERGTPSIEYEKEMLILNCNLADLLTSCDGLAVYILKKCIVVVLV